MKFGGNLGSVIEKIENENSVCVVKVFGESDPRLRHKILRHRSDSSWIGIVERNVNMIVNMA